MAGLAPGAAAHGAGGDPREYTLPAGITNITKFDADGLILAIVQEESAGRVLMMAWMDSRALAYTIVTKRGAYWSRSRSEYWIKGLTSGHLQTVTSLALDCDGDTVLIQVVQDGAACYTDSHSCFDVHPVFEDQAVNPGCRGGDFVVKRAYLR